MRLSLEKSTPAPCAVKTTRRDTLRLEINTDEKSLWKLFLSVFFATMKNYVVEKLNYEFTISTRGVRRNPKLETLPFYRITISSTILLSVEFVLKKLKTTILLSYHFVKRGL